MADASHEWVNEKLRGEKPRRKRPHHLVCTIDQQTPLDFEADCAFIAHSREDIPRLIAIARAALEWREVQRGEAYPNLTPETLDAILRGEGPVRP